MYKSLYSRVDLEMIKKIHVIFTSIRLFYIYIKSNTGTCTMYLFYQNCLHLKIKKSNAHKVLNNFKIVVYSCDHT